MAGLLTLSLLSIVPISLYAQCIDKSSKQDCSTWRQNGHCQSSVDSMKYWCPQTCGFCSTVPTQSPPGGGVCGRTSVQQSRVVNGVHAQPGAWPWIASLQSQNTHWCGGTLLTPTWVLTASHCVETASYLPIWSIKMGAHNHHANEPSAQRIAIKRIIKHPLYTKATLKADFALIELAQPALLNARVTTACLPQKDATPRIGTNCYVAGWGSITYPGPVTNLLQQARLPIVDNYRCRHQQEIVCAGHGTDYHANACQGDSGGPLMCQRPDGSWVLEGVASYVVEYCKYYTGFAPVNKYLDWINQYIR